MNEKKLHDYIRNNNYLIKDETITEQVYFDQIDLRDLLKLEFHNCIFEDSIRFQTIINNNLELKFHNCSFSKTLEIVNCQLKSLQTSYLKKIERIFISGKYQKLHLDSNKKPIQCVIDINECIILNAINCSNLHIDTGQFTLSLKNKISEKTEFRSTFNNSTFQLANFSGFLGQESDFRNFKILESAFFGSEFKKVNFSNAFFGNQTCFTNCKFYSNANFRDSTSIQLFFESCFFESFSHFNQSKFENLQINYTTFEKKTSFDRLEVNTLELYQTSFNQGSFFDELNIKSISNKKYIKSITGDEALKLRRTLRQIKQELQKTENRIDYNRFRGYELQAYYQELNWKENFKDKAILWATKTSTGFEHSWTKALRFVLTGALIFYSLFFISEKYMLSLNLDLSSLKDFASGYFRFLIITDFYNPLEQKRIFIDNSNTTGWIIFILGKIVLAFGIYEMTQAFRKFKA
ncbi:hypothetical protein ABS768_11570 [Flavobacterium sp. ST-75]|uniref:Pentapeptide repeat-containing protein n=1 Tax=Flavobacterium rhizophilum TaxID=3163296 RepID=A0ABW8YFV8_9FLAO